MFINYWLDRGQAIIEREILLVKPTADTGILFNKMPASLPAICPKVSIPRKPEDFAFKVGHAHHLRLSKFGIEGVLKVPRKFQRLQAYVLHDINQPNQPFWVVLYKEGH